jgi:hypothetical protein
MAKERESLQVLRISFFRRKIFIIFMDIATLASTNLLQHSIEDTFLQPNHRCEFLLKYIAWRCISRSFNFVGSNSCMIYRTMIPLLLLATLTTNQSILTIMHVHTLSILFTCIYHLQSNA